MKDSMSLNQVARELGHTSDAYVRRLVKAGSLRATLVGGRYEVERADFEALSERLARKKGGRSKAWEQAGLAARP